MQVNCHNASAGTFMVVLGDSAADFRYYGPPELYEKYVGRKGQHSHVISPSRLLNDCHCLRLSAADYLMTVFIVSASVGMMFDVPLGAGKGRPVSYANPYSPATEVTAETAATLAAASLAFNATDPAYAAELLQHASDIFDIASVHPQSYMDSKDPGAAQCNTLKVLHPIPVRCVLHTILSASPFHRDARKASSHALLPVRICDVLHYGTQSPLHMALMV